ncbi:hypothetical protein [Paenibacillus sp. YYML68]|uniref:hypothetical protein n=1 Tax=Paenibacillus sp. YYML68 TaxID=2909250 RepID=UPI00248FC09B|nr:hypothetical protein [Paenibacillus sp. YYML68]
MNYLICQKVTIVDMNDEIITEALFEHGSYDLPSLSIGHSVVTYQLGLKEFEVVYDKREGKMQHFKVVDVEINLMDEPAVMRAYLEPVKLIVGQHDIGLL